MTRTSPALAPAQDTELSLSHPTAGAGTPLFRFRLLWWLGVAVAFSLFIWLLGPTLTPFAVGAAVAYFLDPIVSRLARYGLPRVLVAAVLILLVMALLIAGVLIVVPLLATEAATLIRALPGLYEDAQTVIVERLPGLGLTNPSGPAADVFAKIGESLTEASGTIFGGVMSGLTGFVRVVVFWVVMPVVAFYLLMDWQRLLTSLDDLLPRARVHTIRSIGRDVDTALAGYLRGVGTVCVILAVYYALALSVAGLNYGLLVGVVAGLISFIPYVGAFVGGALAIGLALYQFWDVPYMIGVVFAIFLFGQFLESQFLVPRLVGNSINLHPVWLIFAVLAFTGLFGLVGAIVAVPVAAAMGVLVRFAVQEYRASRLYASNAGGMQG